tara:strand:- start:2203 stop:2481 length:279 start_codon:yes stop_codon:yes gene_type:complete
MPIYTYKCKVCKNPVENYSKEFCTSDDDAFVGSSCNDQHCNGGLERIISPINTVVRNGGPWAAAIRKDQVDFSSISMEDGFKRMKKSQGVIQ